MYLKFLAFLLLPAAVFSLPSPPKPLRLRQSNETFLDHTIFSPPATYNSPRVLYTRTVEIDNGTLLATWENYSPEPPLVYFPIYQSTDQGSTWTQISNVTDQVNNWGLRYQPFLYQTTASFGSYPAGTILCAGNSIPTNLSNTQIDLYASTDKGYTWTFVSHIAAGGEAEPDNGLTPVWEPFLMAYNNSLVVYYSDQRDASHGQKLVHQTSSDLLSWTDPVDDVAYANYTARPGMTTVTQLPNGQYMMTYEYGGGPGFSSYSFPVYYRIASNPLDFNESEGYPVIGDGVQPTSSPYVTWSSVGGKNGTILVSSGSEAQLFWNQELGAVDGWHAANTSVAVAYSRHLRVLGEDEDLLLVMGAGALPPSNNTVTVSVLDIEATVA